ncbi:hypothetical protein ABZ953_06900 [Streptomyces sp. NPDC046465]|uniref:phage tail fiber protein n=1 Tax=Streptomyces sp. NPDC046465 TaxID=3155810 RepID=UPI0033FF5A9B
MADALSNTAENRALDWLMGTSTTAPTLPLKVALVTANGSDSAAGTESTGGSYARKNLAVGASSSGATSNSADIVWTGMPAGTIVGVEIWDSAGTPIRWWYGALTTPRTLASGDECRFPAGALAVSLA